MREAFLRLRTRDPATDLIVDVQRLAELPPGTTVILAVTPSISADALDWLNLNRPLVADRRLNIVLWCEGDAAAVLARGAPDFFDWISARVDCPPAPAVFAVADVKAAICARAPGIAWAGPGLEETLTAVHPGRPIRRVAVASYQSMIDALTSREPGWLFLDGIETEFHLRRLQWAMAETGRRVIVLRPAIAWTYSGWWTVQAEHAPIADVVYDVIRAGGTGRLAALTGLDPTACVSAMFLLQNRSRATQLEDVLMTATEPREALRSLVRTMARTDSDGFPKTFPVWMSAAMQQACLGEADHYNTDDSSVVSRLREQPLGARHWGALGSQALDFGDFEIARRWLNVGLRLLPNDEDPPLRAWMLLQRGRAQRDAGDLVSARADFEQAYSSVLSIGDTPLLAMSAAMLGLTLIDQGEPQLARKYLESALNLSTNLDPTNLATLLVTLAASLILLEDFATARQHLERSLWIREHVLKTDKHFSIATGLGLLGMILIAQGDLDAAHAHLQRSLELDERAYGSDHPKLIPTLGMLARLQRDAGDLTGARNHLERALAIQKAVLGERRPETAELLVRLADVLAVAGELNDAQVTLERAFSIQQQVLGDDGQLAGSTTRRELAKVLTAKGDLTGAIENLQRALATQRRIFERGDHPDIAATQRELERLQALQREVQRPD